MLRQHFVLICLCFSVVIWLGDLNYRLVLIDAAEVKRLIADNELRRLQEYDQVHAARECPMC